jgi:hypothetical protein
MKELVFSRLTLITERGVDSTAEVAGNELKNYRLQYTSGQFLAIDVVGRSNS